MNVSWIYMFGCTFIGQKRCEIIHPGSSTARVCCSLTLNIWLKMKGIQRGQCLPWCRWRPRTPGWRRPQRRWPSPSQTPSRDSRPERGQSTLKKEFLFQKNAPWHRWWGWWWRQLLYPAAGAWPGGCSAGCPENGVFLGESTTKLTHQMVQDLVPWPDSSGTPDDCLELGHVHLEQAEKINIMSKIFLWYNKKDQWNAHVVQGAVQLVDGVAMLEENLHFSWKGVVLSVVVSEVSFFTWFLSFACLDFFN